MLISVITPCFNEEDNVAVCRDEVRKTFQELLPDYDYEHIFSDNASHDKTVERLLAMARDDKRVKIIVNARNLGPFRNTFNALKSASGDAVVVQLPADLQYPPSLIPEFIRHWKAGYKVVYAAPGTMVAAQSALALLSPRCIDDGRQPAYRYRRVPAYRPVGG